MVSIWWVVCGFLFGGLAGMTIFVFMSMAAQQGERALLADEAQQRVHLGRISLEEHFRA